MYCSNCGSKINEKSVLCPHCGTILKKEFFSKNTEIGWGILGFFVPVVGLILYLIWLETKPKIAKTAGLGALCGVSTIILFWILYFLFFVLLLLVI
ncbi:zinc-ribbon domain-containing protein [Enterococcus plantarum]|uniref:zinc-ribbon domain-containing protein n=1 Tax=Enterococcus plantarum TaxID=1077675 RepID=UPI001A90B258|nr:zinc-ribbon domain-containing protein [Enterococcus plantarum]MBO0466089.1 zinc-ribbon domain-containing protein [Enterococcus plantarum]